MEWGRSTLHLLSLHNAIILNRLQINMATGQDVLMAVAPFTRYVPLYVRGLSD
jgi:hypothetical protein